LIDDPYKDGEQADSEAWQATVRDFWEEVAIPRLGPGVAVVIIQTRWRHDDLTGWLQSQDHSNRWRVINIPAQADHDPNKGETDPLGREPGEYLESARGRTVEDWELKRLEVGERSWNALFQGRPSPATGNMFKREWWRFYDQPLWVERADGSRWAIGFDEVIASWDMTFKDTEGTDYVCGQVWGRRGVEACLLDQVHDRLSFVDTCLAVRTLAARWPQAVVKLVEDKANGPAVINQLSRKVAGLIPVEPDGSKAARAAAVSPFVEAGNVLLPAPEIAPWVDGLIEEAVSFPRAANDDRVDAMSQALNRLLLNPILFDEVIVEDAEDDDFGISPY
jgi:predicted phage terminase large subunit-like protein